jgi:hypothetical protein
MATASATPTTRSARRTKPPVSSSEEFWVYGSIVPGGILSAAAWGFSFGLLGLAIYVLAASASIPFTWVELCLAMLLSSQAISAIGLSCLVKVEDSNLIVRWLFRKREIDLRKSTLSHRHRALLFARDGGPALMFTLPWWRGRDLTALRSLEASIRAAIERLPAAREQPPHES